MPNAVARRLLFAATMLAGLFLLECSLVISTDGLADPQSTPVIGNDGGDSGPGDSGGSRVVDATDVADRRVIPDGAVWPGNGHVYVFVLPSAGISWTGADEAARAMGGHLATISSQAENEFVFSLLGGRDLIWIGGRQPAGAPEPAGNWGWITGEPFDFTAWAAGQPNNDGDEDAIRYGSSTEPTWNDSEHGAVNNGYVVEIE
jgi:hypothetical protein